MSKLADGVDGGESQTAPDPIDMMVGATVRRLRREKGMSQQELALGCRVQFQQIQKYERGANRISCSMLFRIGKTLGVPPADILPDDVAFAAYEPTSDSLSRALITDFALLSSSAQQAICRLVHDLAYPVEPEL